MTGSPHRRPLDGNLGEVLRDGDHVIRPAGPWTPAVHRLLGELASAGVAEVPAPVGVTSGGRERLTFLPGDVPAYPMPSWVWSDEALLSAARLLRRVHDATVNSDRTGPWRSRTHDPPEVICHNDFAPYNLVFDAGTVVGVIDWDFASPGPRLWDLAYLAYRIAPLSTANWGDARTAPQRLTRVQQLLDSYGSQAGIPDLLRMVRERLLELADVTDGLAGTVGRPELHDHATLYRRDADQLPGR